MVLSSCSDYDPVRNASHHFAELRAADPAGAFHADISVHIHCHLGMWPNRTEIWLCHWAFTKAPQTCTHHFPAPRTRSKRPASTIFVVFRSVLISQCHFLMLRFHYFLDRHQIVARVRVRLCRQLRIVPFTTSPRDIAWTANVLSRLCVRTVGLWACASTV